MDLKEKPFPRGGCKVTLSNFKKARSISFLKKPNRKVKKKTKNKTRNKNVVEKKVLKTKSLKSKNKLNVKFVEELNADSVQQGMLVLGIVSEVADSILHVSLPGCLRGVVPAANISEFYTESIKISNLKTEILTLKEMFQPGDILPVKILFASEESRSLTLTCDPVIINSNLRYDVLTQGLILTGNVKSEEDHGFIIDFGIDHTYGFLNFDKIENDTKLRVGRIIRCAIISCNQLPGSCHLQLSMLVKDLQNAYLSANSLVPLSFFLPGFQFKVTVTKVLLNGIEVECTKGLTVKGYIHEDQLFNKFPNLSKIALGSKVIATLLYVKSLVNIPYFKIMPKKKVDWPFEYGDIVKGKVIKPRRTGLVVKVFKESKTAKCIIPIGRLKNGNKLIKSEVSIESLYPVNKKIPKLRLMNRNYMGRFYLGATDKESLQEKYFAVNDLKCGDVISCTISSFTKNSAHLKIGRSIRGIVAYSDMTDIPLKDPKIRFKIGQQVLARVMEVRPEMKFVRMVMKPSLIKEKDILLDYKFEKGKFYTGIVIKVFHDKLFVKFFNNVSGWVPKRLTPHVHSPSLRAHFNEGQLIKFLPLQVTNDLILLSLLQSDVENLLIIGKKYDVVVSNITHKGLLLDVRLSEKKTCSGYMPKELLSMHHHIVDALLATYSEGEKFSAYCILNENTEGLPVMGKLEFFDSFYEGKTLEQLESLLTVDSVLPFLYKNKNFTTQQKFLYSLIPKKNFFKARVVLEDDAVNGTEKFMTKYQLIFGKIKKITDNKIDVSTKVSDVWDKDFHSSLEFLDNYLLAINNLVDRQKEKLSSYSQVAHLGREIKGEIEEIRSKHAIVKTEDGDLGLVDGKFARGQKITGRIYWIDALEQMIYIAASFSSPSNETKPYDHSFEPKWSRLYAKVVFFNNEIVVVQLRGKAKGRFAYIPRKRHLNDFEVKECPFTVGEELAVRVMKKNSKCYLAMDARVVAHHEKLLLKSKQKKLKESIVSLKRKLENEKLERNVKRIKESNPDDLEIIEAKIQSNGPTELVEEMPEIKQELDDDNDAFLTNNTVPRLEYDDIDIKSEVDEEIENLKSKACNEEKISLSSSSSSESEDENPSSINADAFKVGFKWEVLKDNALLSKIALKNDESHSEDEEEESKTEKKKKKRLTESERLEKSKTEEQRLRYIEEKLMNPDREPETIDDFDRAVLSNPDSSALWLKYMAFHIQGTEIEAARTVARRALKAISFRKEQEKLNIWIALLNLENLYGCEQTLNKTLNEALQFNDPYKIHLHMLNLHGQSNNLQEMEKLGNYMLKKYKDVENMWYEVGTAFFIVGKVESARFVLQRAMTILNKKQHIFLVSKFAQLENKYGSQERAQTLYESILGSFPKRVDIWSCYVDMLVKSNHIDLARQVLERATSQSLRPRKMKTLFKKFLTFEETHGTPEDVEKVREAAVEYVQTVGNLNER